MSKIIDRRQVNKGSRWAGQIVFPLCRINVSIADNSPAHSNIFDKCLRHLSTFVAASAAIVRQRNLASTKSSKSYARVRGPASAPRHGRPSLKLQKTISPTGSPFGFSTSTYTGPMPEPSYAEKRKANILKELIMGTAQLSHVSMGIHAVSFRPVLGREPVR